MILYMRNIYSEYLNKANKANKIYDEICICTLVLKQELYISNKEREQVVFLLQQQIRKVKCYEKLIDSLQSLVFVKPDKFLPFIENLIDQRSSKFTYVLLPLVNNQLQSKNKHPIQNTYIRGDDGSLGSGNLTKALPNPFIFIDKKDLSIDQWLSKMQGKFEINQDHQPTNQNKFIYTEN